jgi:hypothetical protein
MSTPHQPLSIRWSDDCGRATAYRDSARYIADLVLAGDPDTLVEDLAFAGLDRGEQRDAYKAIGRALMDQLHECRQANSDLERDNRELRQEKELLRRENERLRLQVRRGGR